MVVGQGLIQIIALIMMPFISRVVDAETIANWGILLSFAILMQGFGFLKSEISIVQADDEKERKSLFVFGVFSFTCINILACIFTGGQYFGEHGQSSLWVFLFLTGISLTGMFQAYELSRDNFKKLTIFRFCYNLIVHPIGLLLAFILGNAYLIQALMIAAWLPILIYISIQTKWQDWLQTSLRNINQVINKHKHSMTYLSLTSVLNGLNSHFFLLLVSFFFPAKLVASYFFAERICNAPISLVNASLSQYNFRKFENLFKNQKFSTDVIFKEWFLWGLLILPFYALLFFFGTQFTTFIFGADWTDAGGIISLLALSFFSRFLSATTDYAFIVLHKQKVLFQLSILYIFRPILLFILAKMGWNFMELLYVTVVLDIVFMLIRNTSLYFLIKKATKVFKER